MASRNLDVALRIQANLTEARNQIEKLRERLDQLGTTGKSTAENLKSTAAAVDKSAAALKTEAVAADAATKAHAKLAPTVDAGSKAMAKGAMSAAQYNMAMRQLPMQITDIVTGLASGQSVFMVGIQQGGQLKDSFGGVAPAARALLGAINPMVVGVAAGAGAFALIGKAVFDSYQELQGYERALISTGNVAGTTAGEIADMADRVGDATGSYGDAEQAALALAQSGKLGADVLEQATQAAVDLARLTGDSIQNTADQISKLAAAPSAQLRKLNDQYHFLSVAVYEQVVALEKEGKTNEALKLAIDAVADAHRARVRQMVANMGYLERSAIAVRDTFAEIWQGLKAIGRDDPNFNLKVAQTRLQQALSIPTADPGRDAAVREAEAAVRTLQAQVDRLKKDAATAGGKQRADDAGIAQADAAAKRLADDQAAWDRLHLENLDKEKKLEQEINEIRRLGGALKKSEAEIEKEVAAARARNAQSSSRGSTAGQTAAGRDQAAAERELENLQKQLAMVGLLEASEKRVTEVERVRYEIEQGSYRLASDATKQQLLQQAAALDAATKARADEVARQQAIEKTTRAYETLKDSLRTPAEAQLDAAIANIKTLNAALDAGIIKADEYQAQVGRTMAASFDAAPKIQGLSPAFGQFSSEEDRLAEQGRIVEEWYATQLEKLQEFRSQKEITQEQWNAQELAVEQAHQQALGDLNRAHQQLLVLETASAFDSMAQLARTFAGEQSTTYKVLFAISKGFAIAQAAVALAQNVAEASKVGFPYNIPMIAGALAQGAQIASLLAAAQYASGGRINGPGSGTSDSVPIWASAGEFMVRHAAANQPGAQPFLEDFNARGMAALQDWCGYADGGVITDREARAPVGDAGARATSVNNRMRVYLLNNEDELAQRLSQHPALEKAVVAIARQNGNSIRAEW